MRLIIEDEQPQIKEMQIVPQLGKYLSRCIRSQKMTYSRSIFLLFPRDVTLGNLNIAKIIAEEKAHNPEYEEGAPIFITGKDLLKYRQ